MNEYLKQVNSLPFYLITGGVLLFILIMCVVFLVKSYRAGIAIGMDKKVMRRAIMSSATFSVLPGVSILLGVIALSGSLGVPLSWLRLSVVGALQYELNVAEIAATGMGLSGLKVSEMSIGAFTTIALVMTAGILSGITCCIFGLKKYTGQGAEKSKRKMTAADLALALMPPSPCLSVCAAHISVPMWEPGPLSKTVRLFWWQEFPLWLWRYLNI